MISFRPRKIERMHSASRYRKFRDQLKPFRNHPFKVRDDQRMLDTVDSIREYGVLVGLSGEGGYELISGIGVSAAEMAGLQTMPVIIRFGRMPPCW